MDKHYLWAGVIVLIYFFGVVHKGCSSQQQGIAKCIEADKAPLECRQAFN